MYVEYTAWYFLLELQDQLFNALVELEDRRDSYW